MSLTSLGLGVVLMLDLRQRKKTVLDLDNNMTSHGQKVTVIGKYHWYKPRVATCGSGPHVAHLALSIGRMVKMCLWDLVKLLSEKNFFLRLQITHLVKSMKRELVFEV